MRNSHKSLRKIQIEKWAKDLNRPFTKKGSPNGQYMYEKMLNFISYQGNASQNHNAAPLPKLPEALWKGQPAWVGELWCSSWWAEGLSLTASGMSVAWPLWKTAWHHLLKLQVSYDLEVPFFSRYVPNRNGYICAPKNMFRNLLQAPLYKIAPTGNRPNLHQLVEYIVVHGIQNYNTAARVDELQLCATISVTLANCEPKKPNKKRFTVWLFSKACKTGVFSGCWSLKGQ